MKIVIRKSGSEGNIWNIKEDLQPARSYRFVQRVGYIRRSIRDGRYQVRIDILADAADEFFDTLPEAKLSAARQLKNVDRFGNPDQESS